MEKDKARIWDGKQEMEIYSCKVLTLHPCYNQLKGKPISQHCILNPRKPQGGGVGREKRRELINQEWR